MNPMMKLASALSRDLEQLELEDELNKMSVEDLSEILRNFEAPVEKTAAVRNGSHALITIADSWGRELAKTAMEKRALGFMPSMVGNAMKAAVTTPLGTRAAVGAAGGALAGAATGHGAQQGPNGQMQGGNRLRRAVGGALVGGALGAGAKGMATEIGSMNNRVGRYAGGALTSVAKGGTGKKLVEGATGSIPAMRAAQDMEKARRGTQATAKAVAPKVQAKVPAANPKQSPGLMDRLKGWWKNTKASPGAPIQNGGMPA
jgi:hypothetical protein